MKATIITSIIAFVSISCAVAQVTPEKSAAEKPAVASIVGSWKIKGSALVWTFTAENRLLTSNGGKAVWKRTVADESKYDLKWVGGTTSELNIDPAGKSMLIAHSDGRKGEAERVPAQVLAAQAADPILGDWRASKTGVWTFHADGSVVASGNGVRGIWKSVKTSTVERKYEIQWNKGEATSLGSMERGERKMRFKDSKSGIFDLERVEEAKAE